MTIIKALSKGETVKLKDCISSGQNKLPRLVWFTVNPDTVNQGGEVLINIQFNTTIKSKLKLWMLTYLTKGI